MKTTLSKYDRLHLALEISLKLQNEYAELLNAKDGGYRVMSPNADAWIERCDVWLDLIKACRDLRRSIEPKESDE